MGRKEQIFQRRYFMIRAAAIVLVLLLIGDVVSERLSLPIPGAAIGLVVLAMAFAVRGGPDEGSEARWRDV